LAPNIGCSYDAESIERRGTESDWSDCVWTPGGVTKTSYS
jgi:hypothetical protein